MADIRQRTIKQSVSATGVGLHKGNKIQLTLRAAPENTGVIFRRMDLDPVVDIKADPKLVRDTQMCTCLIDNSGNRLSTVEHLLSAVAGIGIDNLIVEVDSDELPIMDGSASPFVYLLQSAGVIEQNVAKKFIRVTETIRVEDDDKWAELRPHDGFRVDFAINFDHPVISQTRQRLVLDIEPRSFIDLISPARTFGFMRDIEYLHANNLALGASLENAVGLDEFNVLNEDGLRCDDEFVKHKILDAIGDLYMANHNLLAELVAYKSGHDLNNKLICALLDNPQKWEFVTYENEQEAIPEGFAAPVFS